MLLSHFLSSYLTSLNCSRIPPRISTLHLLLCLLKLLLAETVSQNFLDVDDLDNFEEYLSGFCRMFLHWDLFFSWLHWGLCVLRGKTTDVKCHSYHIISKESTINMTHHWCEPWSHRWIVCYGFLHCEVTLPPFHTVLFERKSLCTAHT